MWRELIKETGLQTSLEIIIIAFIEGGFAKDSVAQFDAQGMLGTMGMLGH